MARPPTLQTLFTAYAKVGEKATDGKTITLTNVDMWFNQAKLIDGKLLTLTDTGICFNKFKSRTIAYYQFVTFLEDLAKYKNIDVDELKTKLLECGLIGDNEKKPEKPKKFGE
ncbi:hypothetical protein FQA39_LY01760 [Lamprigera yunnana]|nr:hypothetical protein FQA39_LY01760 [Lamprigera yunnana]